MCVFLFFLGKKKETIKSLKKHYFYLNKIQENTVKIIFQLLFEVI